MVDKITVNPSEVRGAGDIVSPKTSSDFSFYNSYIQSSTQSVNDAPMTVYQMFKWGNYNLVLDFDKFVAYSEELTSFPVEVTLKNQNDKAVVGATLTCTVNGNTVLSGVTNSRGMVTFNVPVTHDGFYDCTVKYSVQTSTSGGVSGVTKSFEVYVVELNNIRLRASLNPVGIGDTSVLLCNAEYVMENKTFPAPFVPISFYEEYVLDKIRMFGRNVVGSGDVLPLQARVSDIDGSGIPDQPVKFFEEWEDGDLIFVNPVPAIQTGDVATVSARLSDVDGSGISGETIMFYEEYEVSSIHVKVDKPVVETGGVVPVSASLHDVDGSRIQVAGTPVNFYEEYIISDVNLYGDKTGIIPGEIVGFKASVRDEDGSAVPNQDVIFFEEFTRTYLDVDMSREVMVSDEVSQFSALLRDSDGSRIRNSVVEFTEDFDSTDWNIWFDEISSVVGINEETTISAYVSDDNLNPVSGVYVRFVADMIPEEMIIPDSAPEPVTPEVGSVNLVGTGNSILSGYDGDTYVLTATVKDENNNVMEDETVVFKVGSTTLATKTTNSQGVATYTYSASGNGDVSFTATAGEIVSSAVNVEDCIFYDANERSATTTSSMVKSKIYDGLSLQLPSSFEWSVDMKVSSTSGSEDRLWLTPTEFNGEQVPYSILSEFAGTKFRGGVRINGTTYGSPSNITASANTYYSFKAVVNGSSISYSANETNVGTLTDQNWISNYDTWWFAYSLWKRPSIKLTWKNMKIKRL